MKKRWIIGAFLCMCLTMFLPVNKAQAAVKPTKLYISATKKTLYTGQQYDINIKSIKPATAAKSVSWSSGNKRIATVNKVGLVTAKRSGTVYITGTCKQNRKVKARCKVKVKYGVKNSSMTMNKKSATIYEKKTVKLSIKTWKPSNTKVKTVHWSSSNKSVATVSSYGTVTGKCAGTATITAKNTYGKKVTCKITVKYVAVTNVKLDKSAVKMKKGDTFNLRATVTPSNAKYKNVVFKSSQPAVATVDSTGKVACTGTGSAIIVATERDGKFSAECRVEVDGWDKVAHDTSSDTTYVLPVDAKMFKIAKVDDVSKCELTLENARKYMDLLGVTGHDDEKAQIESALNTEKWTGVTQDSVNHYVEFTRNAEGDFPQVKVKMYYDINEETVTITKVEVETTLPEGYDLYKQL